MKKVLAIFLVILLGASLAGCQPKEKVEISPALSLFIEGLREKKLSGPFGRFGWLRDWSIYNVEYSKLTRQTLITTSFETTDYYILLKYDFRSSNFEWSEFGAVKLDSIDKVDIEQPYRFWLRRFFFAASHL